MVEIFNSLSYEDQIYLLIYFMMFFLLVIDTLYVFRWLYLCIHKLQKRRNDKKIRIFEDKQDYLMVKKLVRDPDPLSELLRFERLVENNKIDPRKGPEVVKLFFREIAERWELFEVGPFDAIVAYDNVLHRSEDSVMPGVRVQVVRPGWKVGNILVKPAMVVKKGK